MMIINFNNINMQTSLDQNIKISLTKLLIINSWVVL